MTRRARSAETGAAAQVLAHAFSNDPLLLDLLGGQRDIIASLSRYFEIEAGLAL